LGRSTKNGEAIALLGVDEFITDDILDKIRDLPQVVDAHTINF
jgi:hypothetical protein